MSDGVHISLERFYAEFRDTVKEFHTAVALLHTTAAKQEQMEKDRRTLEKRTGALERWRAKAVGIALGAGALMGVVTSLLVWIARGAI